MEMIAVRKLPLALIDDSQRKRPVDPVWAAALGELMAADGQQTAIKVRWAADDKPRRLIAGGHRVAAARLQGWAEIDAEEVKCSDAEADLLEIDENLLRRGLTILEEAAFLAERKRVYEALHPSAKNGGDRKSDQFAQIATRSVRFTLNAADALKKSERTIQSRIGLIELLVPEAVAALLATPHADDGGALAALARLEPALQRRAVKLVTQEREPLPTLAAAITKAQGRSQPLIDVDRDQLAKLVSAWRKAGARARKDFLSKLANDGVKLPEPGR